MSTKVETGQGQIDLLGILLRSVEAWNDWRLESPELFIDLSFANLSSADLRGANLREAYFEGANLQGANLEGADLRGAIFRGANLRWANFRGANLYGSVFREANLSEAYLEESNLEGADIERADLRGADLRRANLEGANIRGAYLEGANLEGANIRGINLRGAAASIFKIRVFDQDIDTQSLEELSLAIDSFAEAIGYTNPEVIYEEFGSFFRDIRYQISRFITPEVREEGLREGEEFYRRGKESAKAQLERPGVESTTQIATATAELLKSIENYDNVVLILGKVIIVKLIGDDGRSQTIIRSVTTEMQNKLEASPLLFEKPEVLMQFLQDEREKTMGLMLPSNHNFLG